MVTTTAVMTEAELSDAVLELAHLFGWRVLLVRPARTSHGWRTPFGADGVGWPDLTLLRGQRLVVAELKSERGRLTSTQQDWLDALGTVAEVHVWRPAQWVSGEIEAALRVNPALMYMEQSKAGA